MIAVVTLCCTSNLKSDVILWVNLQDLGVIGNGTGGHVGMTRSSPIPSLTGSTTSENRRPGCGTSCCSRGLCGTRSTCGRKPILRRSRQANLPGLRGLRRRIREAHIATQNRHCRNAHMETSWLLKPSALPSHELEFLRSSCTTRASSANAVAGRRWLWLGSRDDAVA